MESIKVGLYTSLEEKEEQREIQSDLKRRPKAELGDWITLDVSCYSALATHNPKVPLQLYISALPVQDSGPFVVNSNGDHRTLRFQLLRSESSSKTWTTLLGKPTAFTRQVLVSVGPPNCGDDCKLAAPESLDLIMIRPLWFTAFVLLLVIVLTLLYKYGRQSGLLRDSGPAQPVTERLFSLGRTQMACWFFLIVASFVFIWLVTGSLASITTSVLTLMGISAGTALGAAVIDDSKRLAIEKEKLQLAQEKSALQTQVQELQAQILQSTDGAKMLLEEKLRLAAARVAQIDVELSLTQVVVPQRTRGFWRDILSDGDAISLHRFQVVVWTAVLGIVFLSSVYVHLAMPDFGGELLALMGVSSGTYLGFKIPEKPAT